MNSSDVDLDNAPEARLLAGAGMPETRREYVGITATAASCLDCGWDAGGPGFGAEVWRASRRHVADAGHRVWVEQARDFVVKPAKKPGGSP